MEMFKFKLILLALVLFPMTVNAAAPTRIYNYVAHTTIDPAQNNTNENALYTYLQAGVDTYASGSITNDAVFANAAIAYSKLNLLGSITNNDISNSAAITYSKLSLTNSILNADINSAAGIVDTKLAQITTASKVSGAAITSISSLPSGAGLVPTANLGSGSPSATNFLRGDQTFATPPNLSNIIYSWTGQVDLAGSGSGIVISTTLADTSATTGNYSYLKSANATGSPLTRILLRTKFKKITGLSTLTIYAYVNENTNAGGSAVSVQLNVDSLNITTATSTNTSYTWVNSSGLDISSLVDGTIYDMTIGITTNGIASPMYGYLGSVIIIGS